MTPPKKQPSRPIRKRPAKENAGSTPVTVRQDRYNLRVRRHRRDIYPNAYRISFGGSRPHLAGLLADLSSNERIARNILGYLDDRDYDALRRTNTHIQTQLEIREHPDEQTRAPGQPPILMFEQFLPPCNEFEVGRHLVNSHNREAYRGACPHDRGVAPTYVRRCEDLPAQDYVEGRLVNQAKRHDVHTQNVCRGCRLHYHTANYSEDPDFYLPSNGSLRMTNEGRLKDLVRWQQIHTCHDCDIQQRRLHPHGHNSCTCRADIYHSHWRCWECTRHTFDLASQEAIHRVNRQNRIRRDADYNVKFNGWGDRTRRAQCLCGRNPQQAPTSGYQTRQCIRCFGYIVRAQAQQYAPIRRSVRIRNRQR